MLFILGDSHIAALRDGFARLSEEERRAILQTYRDVQFRQLVTANNLRKPFFEAGEDEVRLLGRAERAFSAVAKKAWFRREDKRYFLFCAGFHNATAVSEIAKDFTIDPAVKGKSFLSDEALRRLVEHANEHLMLFFEELRKLGVQFAVLGSPPVPIEQLAKYGMGPEDAAQLPPMIDRAKAIVAEQLSAAHVRCILPPPEVAEGGYLRPELAAHSRPGDDHGNAAYGEIMLRHVFRSLEPGDFK